MALDTKNNTTLISRGERNDSNALWHSTRPNCTFSPFSFSSLPCERRPPREKGWCMQICRTPQEATTLSPVGSRHLCWCNKESERPVLLFQRLGRVVVVSTDWMTLTFPPPIAIVWINRHCYATRTNHYIWIHWWKILSCSAAVCWFLRIGRCDWKQLKFWLGRFSFGRKRNV